MNNKLMPVTVLLAAFAAALGSAGCQGNSQADHASRPPVHASQSPSPAPRVLSAHASDENLADISCISESDCFLVGAHSRVPAGTPDVSLIGRWDGSRLSLTPGPNITEPDARRPGGDLNRVTCPNARECWATGRYGYSLWPGGKPFFAHWNGTAWSAAAVPLPRRSDPDASAISMPSCASATDCWAVGYAGVSVRGGLRFGPLAVHWNGSAWSLAPVPGEGTVSDLSTVSCHAAGDCWAIGSWAGGPGIAKGGTLTEHWNGTRWSVVRTPTDTSGPPGDVAGEATVVTGPGIVDLSCATPAACMAVGTSRGAHAFAERWTGSSWVLAPPLEPRGSSASNFDAVSCATARWCVAVGSTYNAATHKNSVLIELWNGAAWTIMPTTAPAGANGLADVSCVTTRTCVAVGDTGSAPFLDRWNGHLWTLAAN
jgi:hypothetical protein